MNEKVLKTMTSSVKGDWETPQPFFDICNRRYHFDVDCAAHEKNKKLDNYISPKDDAFSIAWSSRGIRGWLNPEYGKRLPYWMERAVRQQEQMDFLCILVPARIDTQWWWDYALEANEIIFLKGRLKFEGAEDTAPFPSALAIYNNTESYPIGYPIFEWWDWRKDTYAFPH